jgi:hypothetical protein
MSDWDAAIGEAALGLDLAKLDGIQDGLGHVLAGHRGRSSVLVEPAPHRHRPAEPAESAVAVPADGPTATIDADTIFRQEALEFRARGRDTPGGVVRLGTRWIRWGYRITVLLLAAAIASTWVIHTDESVSGPAVVDERTGTVAIVLPAAAAPDLAGSHGLTIALPGRPSVRVTALHAQLASASSIRRAGLVPPAQPAILVTGKLSHGASATGGARATHVRTQATVVLRSESLADVLARQLHSMLGQGAAP